MLERHKDIQYASKPRLNVEHVKQIGRLRGALIRLMDKLPAKLKADPDAKLLASLCDNREWLVVRLVNQRLTHVSQTKDYEFSRATVDEHWSGGLEDVRHVIANRDVITPSTLMPGVRVFEFTDEPASRQTECADRTLVDLAQTTCARTTMAMRRPCPTTRGGVIAARRSSSIWSKGQVRVGCTFLQELRISLPPSKCPRQRTILPSRRNSTGSETPGRPAARGEARRRRFPGTRPGTRFSNPD